MDEFLNLFYSLRGFVHKSFDSLINLLFGTYVCVLLLSTSYSSKLLFKGTKNNVLVSMISFIIPALFVFCYSEFFDLNNQVLLCVDLRTPDYLPKSLINFVKVATPRC